MWMILLLLWRMYIDGEETANRTGIIMKRKQDVMVDGHLLTIDYAEIILRSYEEIIPGGSNEYLSHVISMAGIRPHLQQHADQRFYRVHRIGIGARLESVISPGNYLAILETPNDAKLVLTQLRSATPSLKFDFDVPFDTRLNETQPIVLP